MLASFQWLFIIYPKVWGRTSCPATHILITTKPVLALERCLHVYTSDFQALEPECSQHTLAFMVWHSQDTAWSTVHHTVTAGISFIFCFGVQLPHTLSVLFPPSSFLSLLSFVNALPKTMSHPESTSLFTLLVFIHLLFKEEEVTGEEGRKVA